MAEAVDPAATRATSARTLLFAAAGCLLLGMVVGSPAGAMFGYGLTAVLALASALLARGRWRGAALALWLVALALLWSTYPDFTAHMADYRSRNG